MINLKKLISLLLLVSVFALIPFGSLNINLVGINAYAKTNILIKVEAEKATLSDKSLISKKYSGYTGTGFVLFPAKKTGASLNINPVLKVSGNMQIVIRFANGSKGTRALTLVVNGKTSTLNFPKTFGNSKWMTFTTTKAFKKGTNSVYLKRTSYDSDSVSIDNISVVQKVIPPPTPKPTLSPLKLKFKGKKVLCLGDSITSFCGYPEDLESRLGTTVYNGGISGSKTIGNGGDIDKLSLYEISLAISTGDWTAQDLAVEKLNFGNTSINYATLKSIDFSKIDYIVLAYGTNDFALANPIGTDTDLAPTQQTYKGAINKSLELLKNAYPNIKILLVTPIFRMSGTKDSDTYDWGTGHFLIEFVDATIAVGALNNVPVVDNYRNSPINKKTASKYLNDGTHPNYLGAEYIASKVANAMFSVF